MILVASAAESFCLIPDEAVFVDGRRLAKNGSLAYAGVSDSFSESIRAMTCRGTGTVIAFMIKGMPSSCFMRNAKLLVMSILSVNLDSQAPSCKDAAGRPEL